MLSIFFDLETSDSNFAGQLLNYSFLVVNQSWDVVDELTAEVKLSPLQLPTAGAILTNRVNLAELSKTAVETENQATKKIYAFISKYISQSQLGVNLIGYNSNNFDVQYIRTVLIRNGINPFFSGKLHYRDLLHLVRKLACLEPDFPREIKILENGHRHYSFSLQSITTAFDLLQAEQTHFSKDDVLLTIELAKYLDRKYGIDIRSFKSNDAADLVEPGKIVHQMLPEYDPELGRFYNTTPLALLKATPSGSYWINLNSFLNGTQEKASIQYIGKLKSFFIADEPISTELKAAAKKALDKFRGFDPDLYYGGETSACYLEQDIYRLFRGKRMDRLFEVIRAKQCDINDDEDVRLLFDRYRLENHNWESDQEFDGPMWSRLKEWAIMRYGARLQISKGEPPENCDADQLRRYWAPSFVEAHAEITRLMSQKIKPEDASDLALLQALEHQYRSSVINQAAGFIHEH